MIFLVRHAKAGHRSPEFPDDRLRPLTASGWAQADALAVSLSAALKAAGLDGQLFSSPYVRCVQSLEPLARLIGGDVISEQRLAEGEPFVAMLELMKESPDGAVFCSHGDMIPEAMAAFERRGCVITSTPNWKKGSVWILERNGQREVLSAACWPPPDSAD